MAIKRQKRKLDEVACDPIISQSIIGSLMYAMTAIPPDIAYAIGVLRRYNHDPSNEHMAALKRVVRYRNSTNDWRLHFGEALGGALEGALGGPLGGEAASALRCYIDSDYAGCPDDNKSTSGLVITFGGAVDWRSRKQKSTALSMTDVEYYVFRVGCMRLTEILHLLKEVGIPTIPHGFSDSQSLIASIKNRIYRRTAVALIATKYYLAPDMAGDGEIDLSYVPTAEMLTNCFTKPMPKPALLKLCFAMGMIGIELGKGLGNGLGIGITNGLGNGLGTLRNGRVNGIAIGIGYVVGNAVR